MTDMYGDIACCFKAIDDKFGKDIIVLDISGQSLLADFFVIATGNNPAQIRAIADAAEEQLFTRGVALKHVEGQNSSKWVLMDFGTIIVHIFDKESRDFYNIERVWGDSRIVTPEDLSIEIKI